MSRGIWLFILCVAGRTSGQSMFTSKHDYKSMTEFFEVRHRGNIELPPCVKDLLNCWEVVNTDVFCSTNEKHKLVRFDTICNDLRFQCRETEGYSPFPEESERERFYHYCYDSKQIEPQ
ncbi:uncharacterized protein LOC134804234 isoform X2 [Cydia splendana]|uniref:uncharacterized protein LOC134804234 isoform X2 n=1 Tax=Cydia splendana TaxID=1100963 RepID=UPI0028F4C7D6